MRAHKLVKMGNDKLYCLNCKGSWPVSLAHLPYMECIGVYEHKTPDEHTEALGTDLITRWEEEMGRK